MNLNAQTIAQLAEHLEGAELNARDVTKITDDFPQMDWDDAYAVQDAIRARKEARGHKTVGLKAGLTSFAKMKQMGVDVPVFGFVSDYMSRPDGGEIKTSELIHPKVEAEICVVTKAELKGPGCHVGAVLAAIDFVLPAVEIIDSRYRDFKFDLKSVVADNTSASRFVAGGRSRNVDELDLRTLGVVLEVSLKVLPMARATTTLRFELDQAGDVLRLGLFLRAQLVVDVQREPGPLDLQVLAAPRRQQRRARAVLLPVA